MDWAQTAAIIVAIVAAVGVGAGGIYTSLNGIHAQVAAIQAEAAADRRAMREEAAADRRAMREEAAVERRAVREEAAADRRAMQGAVDAFRSEMLRFAERQSYVEGRLAERRALTD